MDGVGSAASFHDILGLLCTSGGDKLYVSDLCIRMIDTPNQTVTTIATHRSMYGAIATDNWFHGPKKLIFDRTATATATATTTSASSDHFERVMYITAQFSIFRLDLNTRSLCRIGWPPRSDTAWGNPIDPTGMLMTPSGHLIVCAEETHSIYLVDPIACTHTVLAGPAAQNAVWTSESRLPDQPHDLIILEDERCAYVIDHGRLLHMTLPAHLFISASNRK